MYKNAAPPAQSLPVTTTSTTRQQQGYVSSDRRPASSPTTCPASAEPARASPAGRNLRSATFAFAAARQQPSAEKLGRLPTRCPPNPARCYPSVPAPGYTQTVPLGATTLCSSQPGGPRREPPTYTIQKRPLSGPALPHRLQRSPSASCRTACISNKRGQLCSVTWSCPDIPLSAT
jgi:hypothetical protein